jgi:hypothetical protein
MLRPSESLNCEIKTWLDPAQDEHKVTSIRALRALRNQDGGELVLGFDDKTLIPDPLPSGVVVEQRYHVDDINREWRPAANALPLGPRHRLS